MAQHNPRQIMNAIYSKPELDEAKQFPAARG
jgi:hypothetical protein